MRGVISRSLTISSRDAAAPDVVDDLEEDLADLRAFVDELAFALLPLAPAPPLTNRRDELVRRPHERDRLTNARRHRLVAAGRGRHRRRSRALPGARVARRRSAVRADHVRGQRAPRRCADDRRRIEPRAEVRALLEPAPDRRPVLGAPDALRPLRRRRGRLARVSRMRADQPRRPGGKVRRYAVISIIALPPSVPPV